MNGSAEVDRLLAIDECIDIIDDITCLVFGVEKARRPRSIFSDDGFINRALRYARQLEDISKQPASVVRRELDKMIDDANWVNASQRQRDGFVRELKNLVSGSSSKFYDRTRVRVREENGGILRDARKEFGERYNLDIGRSFVQQDTLALQAIDNMYRLSLNHHLQTTSVKFERGIRDVIARGLSEGLSRQAIGRDIKAEIPGTIPDRRYWELVAATHTARSRSWSSMMTMASSGIERYEVVAVLDRKTTDICRMMDGQIISVRSSLDQIDAVRNAKDHDELVAADPFLREKGPANNRRMVDQLGRTFAKIERSAVGRRDAKGSYKLSRGRNFGDHGAPPYHFNCRSTVVPVDEFTPDLTEPPTLPAPTPLPPPVAPAVPPVAAAPVVAPTPPREKLPASDVVKKGKSWFSPLVKAEAKAEKYGKLPKMNYASRSNDIVLENNRFDAKAAAKIAPQFVERAQVVYGERLKSLIDLAKEIKKLRDEAVASGTGMGKVHIARERLKDEIDSFRANEMARRAREIDGVTLAEFAKRRARFTKKFVKMLDTAIAEDGGVDVSATKKMFEEVAPKLYDLYGESASRILRGIPAIILHSGGGGDFSDNGMRIDHRSDTTTAHEFSHAAEYYFNAGGKLSKERNPRGTVNTDNDFTACFFRAYLRELSKEQRIGDLARDTKRWQGSKSGMKYRKDNLTDNATYTGREYPLAASEVVSTTVDRVISGSSRWTLVDQMEQDEGHLFSVWVGWHDANADAVSGARR